MTMRKKLLITIACLSCILCIMVTGTIAWLIDTTPAITNTFTPSNITVSISETDAVLGDDNNYSKNFQMIPGKTYAKDPKVTVDTDIPCYVFVKVEENLGAWTATGVTFKNYFTYSVITGQNGWSELSGYTGVYYRQVSTDGSFYVLNGTDEYANGAITVNGANVTKADMEKLYATNAEMPTLEFTAYAIQQEGFNSAELAWAAIPNT